MCCTACFLFCFLFVIYIHFGIAFLKFHCFYFLRKQEKDCQSSQYRESENVLLSTLTPKQYLDQIFNYQVPYLFLLRFMIAIFLVVCFNAVKKKYNPLLFISFEVSNLFSRSEELINLNCNLRFFFFLFLRFCFQFFEILCPFPSAGPFPKWPEVHWIKASSWQLNPLLSCRQQEPSC